MNERHRGDRDQRDDRDGWQRQSGSDQSVRNGRGDGDTRSRDDGNGPHHDARDPEQVHHHARAIGERGYGSEYRGHDGLGAPHEPARGPKNYVRSDERMREEICERLCEQPHDWSDVEVHVSDGEATLSGTVRSRATKIAGERIAHGVRGIREVMNQIRVARAASPRDGVDERTRTMGSR